MAKDELGILRALSPQASNQQLQAQIEAMLQNLKQQDTLDMQTVNTQSASLNMQPAPAAKKTARDVAEVTRGIVDYLKLGANAEERAALSAIAQRLEQVKGNGVNDRGIINNALNGLRDLTSNNPAIAAQAQQVFDRQQQAGNPELLDKIKALLTKHVWAEDILQKVMGENMLNKTQCSQTQQAAAALQQEAEEVTSSSRPGMSLGRER